MIRLLLILFAVVVLVLLALGVIVTDFLRWECGALAALGASFLPFPDLPVRSDP